jgi:hypothetical protein
MATQIPKILVQIDDEVVELIGENAIIFEADREEIRSSKAAEDSAKALERNLILERLGITDDEAKLLLS